ncbi:MAG: hypothetical protein FWF67_01125 [Fibromonadales bacterium]|nr:hypothetical protein [Fibromonadales bacterium]
MDKASHIAAAANYKLRFFFKLLGKMPVKNHLSRALCNALYFANGRGRNYNGPHREAHGAYGI